MTHELWNNPALASLLYESPIWQPLQVKAGDSLHSRSNLLKRKCWHIVSQPDLFAEEFPDWLQIRVLPVVGCPSFATLATWKDEVKGFLKSIPIYIAAGKYHSLIFLSSRGIYIYIIYVYIYLLSKEV
jgi:hypothetical protein